VDVTVNVVAVAVTAAIAAGAAPAAPTGAAMIVVTAMSPAAAMRVLDVIVTNLAAAMTAAADPSPDLAAMHRAMLVQ